MNSLLILCALALPVAAEAQNACQQADPPTCIRTVYRPLDGGPARVVYLPATFSPPPEPRSALQPDAERPQVQFGLLGNYLANDYGGGGESVALTGYALWANPAHHWGLEAEVSGTVKSPNHQSEVIGLIGPRASFQVSRVTGSLRTQIGAASFNHPLVLPTQQESLYLAVGGGGAVDVRLTRRLNWRAIDAQYTVLPAFEPDRLTPWSIGSGFAFVYGRAR